MTSVTATAVDVRTPETRVAMALYSDLDHDSRVLREAESLAAAGYRVTVYCLSYDGPAIEGFAVVSHRPNTTTVTPGGGGPFRSSAGSGRLRRSLQRATWMRDYIANARAWGRWIVRHAGEVQVWHAHDLPGLISISDFI